MAGLQHDSEPDGAVTSQAGQGLAALKTTWGMVLLREHGH